MIDFADFDLENIPATVVYASRGAKRALVFHPGGAEHENAAGAASKLRRCGYAVTVVGAFRPTTPPIPALEDTCPPWRISGK